MRVLLAVVFLSLLCFSCTATDSSRATKTKPTTIDSPSRVQVEGTDDNPTVDANTGVAALKGKWSAIAHVKGYGVAVVSFSLNEKGSGRYLVLIGGQRQQGKFQVLSWDGSWLKGSVLGYTERVQGTLNDDTLTLVLPYIGTTIAQRE